MTAALMELGASREIEYPTTEAEIARARAEYASLTADTPDGYKEVVEAIAKLRGTRTAVEKRRVELKAEALEFGRKVDGVAKKLTALIADIEDPLKAKKQAVDDEKARIKREAEKAELLALEAKLKADREAAEAKAREEREAEEARLKAQREQQAAEQKRIDDERKALEAKQREIDAKAAEVARREAAARPPTPPVAAAPAPPAARPAPAPAAAPVLSPDPLASEGDHVRAYAREIAALAGRAPKLAGAQRAEAVGWAAGRLRKIAEQLAAFTPEGN